MGKIAKPPKARAGPSIHSRAAKRASSPSINLDKSITSLPRPSSPTNEDADLSNRDKVSRKILDITHRTTASNGITKRKEIKKRGNSSKAQKRRIEIGKGKGEAFLDILHKKADESVKKEQVIKERSGDWDKINSKTHFELLESAEA